MSGCVRAVFAVALGALGGSASAGGTSAPDSVLVTWNEAALEEVRRGRLGPPVVARALAIAHTCIYDAWVPYDPRAVATTAQITRRPTSEQNDANKATAVSYAAYRCLVNLFPAGAVRLEAVLRSLGHEPLNTTTDVTRPQGIGNVAAAAVIASRRNDGANQYGDLRPGAYADYTYYASSNSPMPFCLPALPGPCAINVSNPYVWQPLINDLGVTQAFIAPHWGNVRPFALSSGAQFDARPEVLAGPNYLQSPALYAADVEDILGYSRRLTPQQKLIVEYWADGPASELPPGHWSLFAQYVSRRDRNSIDQDVKMFFAMQNASFDAGIVAWHMKRRFDGVRPITAIRYAKQGVRLMAWGGPGRPIEEIDGGKWSPYNPGSNLTPAFPGYVSGHSTFSAASAAVLRAFTGTDTFGYAVVVPANYGRVEPGVPAVPTTVRYPTLTAAVVEAGLSRLYAGIHYADDNTDGQLLGDLSAGEAWKKSYALFTGNLPAAIYSPGANVTCRNVMLGAQTYANVEVPSGARCVLLGTRLDGNLELRSGASVDVSNATIKGNLLGDKHRDVHVRGGSVDGAIQLKSGQAVSLGGTSAGTVQLTKNDGAISLSDLRVSGDIQIFGNDAGVTLHRNSAGGNLQCDGNDPSPRGAGNTASSKEGQCRRL